MPRSGRERGRLCSHKAPSALLLGLWLSVIVTSVARGIVKQLSCSRSDPQAPRIFWPGAEPLALGVGGALGAV